MKLKFGVAVIFSLLVLIGTAESQRSKKGCFAKCGQKSGPCEDCGPNGLCCKRGLVENGCDGNMGRSRHHTCVTPEEPPTTAAPIIELTVPSYPLECNKNASTRALCKKPENCPQVANKKKGFNTYIFQIAGDVQCFHTFRPKTAEGAVPVQIYYQCYANNGLVHGYNFENEGASVNFPATRSGYSIVGLSSASSGWGGGKGTDFCKDVDAVHPNGTYVLPKFQYVKRVLNWILDHPEVYDANKIFIYGFSRNGNFGGKTMACFNQKIAGAWVGGGGGFPTNETCEATSLARGYPCYVEERPVVYCTAKYYNDPKFRSARAKGIGDPAKNLECNEKEGVKYTFFGFNRSKDKSIKGKHSAIKNVEFWAQSCLGMNTLCSESCEGRFVECMNNKETSSTTQQNRADNFPKCIKEMDNEGACKGCAATLKMLKMSEVPIVETGTERFGENYQYGPYPRPPNSVCKARKIWE